MRFRFLFRFVFQRFINLTCFFWFVKGFLKIFLNSLYSLHSKAFGRFDCLSEQGAKSTLFGYFLCSVRLLPFSLLEKNFFIFFYLACNSLSVRVLLFLMGGYL